MVISLLFFYLLHVFCRWVLFLTILSVYNSLWHFHCSAIIFNGKMFQEVAIWLLYFLRAKGFPGAQKSQKSKNALSICADWHVKWKICIQIWKKTHLCPGNCIYQLLFHCNQELARRFSVTFRTTFQSMFQEAFWLEKWIPNLNLCFAPPSRAEAHQDTLE